MHEAFHQDDPAHFTRPWFAWANGLFGELIMDLSERKPALLRRALQE
jgi:meiotically up-regulated gene 157 (Mug157) protein